MKTRHYIFLLVLLLIAYVAVAYLGITFNKDAINLTATFYTITSGFLATTVTIIYGSKLSMTLYQQRVEEQTRTNLHILKTYLKTATVFLMLGVLLNVGYLVLPDDTIKLLQPYADIVLVFIFLSSVFFTYIFFNFILKAMILAAVPTRK